MTRRRRIAIIAATSVAVAAVLLGTGWGLALAFQSPAQREAAARPSAAAPITAEVVRGDLVRNATLRVDGQRASRANTSIPGQGGGSGVVTAVLVRAGGSVAAGQRLLDVNGVPLVAMPGEFDFYRDLRPGDSGPDVDQLQRGLVAAGRLGGHDGSFGRATERAVRAMLTNAKVPVAEETVARTGPPADGEPAEQRRLVVESSRFVVFRTLPALWTGGPKVGSHLDAESRISYETGEVELTASVSDAAADGLRPGTTGSGAVAGTSRALRVDRVLTGSTNGADADDADADAGGTEAAATEAGAVAASGEKLVVLRGADGPLPSDWAGKTLVVSLEVEVAAKGALLVPTVAVVPGGSQHARVDVRSQDGSFRRIPVREIATLDGTSAVAPVRSESLRPGDQVRVR